jgi:hypothetical protein
LVPKHDALENGVILKPNSQIKKNHQSELKPSITTFIVKNVHLNSLALLR